MRILFQILIIITFVSLSVQSFEQPEPKVEDFRDYSNNFMSELKSVLQKEIKQNGIISAVSVCSDTAQKLTSKFAENNNIYIKRVSTKNRNSNNLPNEFELEAISKFEKMKQEGTLSKATELFEISKLEGITKVTYVKPILTDGVCLSCHGSENNISEEVSAEILKKYPNDKARDYKVGDLRGIISISKIIK